MRRPAPIILLRWLVLIAIAAVGWPEPTTAQIGAAGLVALRARAMVDVERGAIVDDVILLVRDGRIAAAGPRAAVSVPRNADVVDLPATTLLPGLIDAHVHLTLGGRPEDNARATLAAGSQRCRILARRRTRT